MKKLIRDKYVTEIDSNRLTTLSTDSNVYRGFLLDKLYEEIEELADTDWRDVEEYADVYEVFMKIMEIHGVTQQQVIDAQVTKRILKGGFDTGLLLDY